ncbi:hypothetical protein B7494_g4902 [Chlorociboria aeruginascens]|nr:hypothetical protein B7494_g4902 [Chlorociboria aeruginascens]
MAAEKIAGDFQAIIDADRERRKIETLAQEILGKGRRSSAPGPGNRNRKPTSLASRVGVSKRTVSISNFTQKARTTVKPAAGNVDAEWTHDLHDSNSGAARTSQLPPRGPKNTRRKELLSSALNGSSPILNNQFNIIGGAKPSASMSIRGLAGPYVIMAKNFVPGTTAADIEAAMTPVGGVTLGCEIIATNPKIIAEVVFETKEGADNVVATFNNQNADGNLLHVYHKIGAAKSVPKVSPVTPTTPSTKSLPPLGPRADIDTRYNSSDRYEPQGSSRDRDRDYNSNRDEVMDGSYGFDDRMDTDDRNDSYDDKGRGRRGLYSDSMVSHNGHDRGGRGSGNNWDRGRNDRSRGYR